MHQGSALARQFQRHPIGFARHTLPGNRASNSPDTFPANLNVLLPRGIASGPRHACLVHAQCRAGQLSHGIKVAWFGVLRKSSTRILVFRNTSASPERRDRHRVLFSPATGAIRSMLFAGIVLDPQALECPGLFV